MLRAILGHVDIPLYLIFRIDLNRVGSFVLADHLGVVQRVAQCPEVHHTLHHNMVFGTGTHVSEHGVSQMLEKQMRS